MCNQTTILKRFRDGSINALFSTSVAEEGLDVQNCSIVVCYDVPKRPLSVVQTMGRARAHNSEVFFMQPILPWDNTSPPVRLPACLPAIT
jgi:endoribonuclease Dicer